jgi:ribose/xylose/arabinose/galactoside ABC-type transport system permease subunit
VVLVVAALVACVVVVDDAFVALVVASLAAALVAALEAVLVAALELSLVVLALATGVASAWTLVLLTTDPPKNEKKVKPATSQSLPDL